VVVLVAAAVGDVQWGYAAVARNTVSHECCTCGKCMCCARVWWWQKDQWVGDCSRAVSDKATDSELRVGEVEEVQGQDKKAGSVGEKPRR
jgi:hypothetical protein